VPLRFLIDNALSPHVAEALREAGYDATHVRDAGLRDAPDEAIFARASEEERVIVSADTDFGTLLALRGSRVPSVVLFRGEISRRPSKQASTLRVHLPSLKNDLQSGSVVVFERDRIRVRALPIW